jgi:hypothetical protein
MSKGQRSFFEKKDQKTFIRFSPRQPDKSFLLLSYKKEVLAFPCLGFCAP